MDCPKSIPVANKRKWPVSSVDLRAGAGPPLRREPAWSCSPQQTLSRLGQIHPMGIAPQKRRTAVLLQHAEVTAQRRLRNFQVARPGGDAAALHDANKGAEQGERSSNAVIQLVNSCYLNPMATQKWHPSR